MSVDFGAAEEPGTDTGDVATPVPVSFLCVHLNCSGMLWVRMDLPAIIAVSAIRMTNQATNYGTSYQCVIVFIWLTQEMW